MKITITQTVVVLDFPEQEEPNPVPTPPENPLDTLLACLNYEPQDERNTWEVDPHGTIFKV